VTGDQAMHEELGPVIHLFGIDRVHP
jgi:hypothetical protein